MVAIILPWVENDCLVGKNMTPFGKLLSLILLEEGAKQKDLVLATGLSSTQVSKMLSGQKGPPSQEKLELIITHLALAEAQAIELRSAADNSSKTLSIPEEAKPEEYLVAHELCARLGSLKPAQVRAIREIIRFGDLVS